MRTAKALARLRGCAGSPELSLVAYMISTIISLARSLYPKRDNVPCITLILNGTVTKVWSLSFKSFTILAPRRAPTPGSVLLQRSPSVGGIHRQSPGNFKSPKTPRTLRSEISQAQISLRLPKRNQNGPQLSFDMIDEHAKKVL